MPMVRTEWLFVVSFYADIRMCTVKEQNQTFGQPIPSMDDRIQGCAFRIHCVVKLHEKIKQNEGELPFCEEEE